MKILPVVCIFLLAGLSSQAVAQTNLTNVAFSNVELDQGIDYRARFGSWQTDCYRKAVDEFHPRGVEGYYTFCESAYQRGDGSSGGVAFRKRITGEGIVFEEASSRTHSAPLCYAPAGKVSLDGKLVAPTPSDITKIIGQVLTSKSFAAQAGYASLSSCPTRTTFRFNTNGLKGALSAADAYLTGLK